MSITEQIKALPVNCDVYFPFGPETSMTVAELKALAESHERLLKLAKDYKDSIQSDHEGRNGIHDSMKDVFDAVADLQAILENHNI